LSLEGSDTWGGIPWEQPQKWWVNISMSSIFVAPALRISQVDLSGDLTFFSVCINSYFQTAQSKEPF